MILCVLFDVFDIVFLNGVRRLHKTSISVHDTQEGQEPCSVSPGPYVDVEGGGKGRES